MSINLRSAEVHSDSPETGYTTDRDFTNIGAVSVIILNPTRDKVLLMGRRDAHYLALPSGKGALDDDPNNPEMAARKELEHETGLKDVIITPFQTYKGKNEGDSKVGYYFMVMDEAQYEEIILQPKPSRDPNKPTKRMPGWFPIDLVSSGNITLPYEQSTALEDLSRLLK